MSRLFLAFCICIFAITFQRANAQSATSDTPSITSTVPASGSATDVTFGSTVTGLPNSSTATGSGTQTGSGSGSTSSSIPDVVLYVPNLSVGKIELDVDDLQANINLNAQVAGLVTVNAGVAVSIEKVNITIADVEAELELVVRLGHLVDIVNRVFKSLDLNPLLITAINDVTNLVDTVVGEVDGLLGSITQGGNTLSFIVDNLGNIVQQVAGTAGSTVSSIVGNYLQNMTATGEVEQLANGLVQKTYNYSPLNALVNIIFNTAGQVVQATVAKAGGSGSSSTTATGTATPTSTAGSSPATSTS